jgi:hypothetical protein
MTDVGRGIESGPQGVGIERFLHLAIPQQRLLEAN